jgi:hypothetical protein
MTLQGVHVGEIVMIQNQIYLERQDASMKLKTRVPMISSPESIAENTNSDSRVVTSREQSEKAGLLSAKTPRIKPYVPC